MSNNKFDLRTHIRDPKNGRIISTQPYKLEIKDGKRLFERPPGSGMFYFEDGELAENRNVKPAAPVAKAESKPALAGVSQVSEKKGS